MYAAPIGIEDSLATKPRKGLFYTGNSDSESEPEWEEEEPTMSALRFTDATTVALARLPSTTTTGIASSTVSGVNDPLHENKEDKASSDSHARDIDMVTHSILGDDGMIRAQFSEPSNFPSSPSSSSSISTSSSIVPPSDTTNIASTTTTESTTTDSPPTTITTTTGTTGDNNDSQIQLVTEIDQSETLTPPPQTTTTTATTLTASSSSV
ncbi:hypothetical protein K435DRAFT_780518 [Dendrothele bispora CBS 962.96]|uniref:Uncharacterized protein n=1 Tax=Dendrothele bispora (strain CBS 962.96) TaxID=1314807 RepID=A0A4S8LS44_DENBC|nr:hypothetical protein K435DRAFT_780518 [Dendrothele bispora CBS 962.96]